MKFGNAPTHLKSRSMVILMRVCLATVVAVGVFVHAESSRAAAILSPTSVVANTLGELAAGFEDENLINQSGLSSGFTSGVTDFGTYIGSSPTHLGPGNSGSVGYASPNSITTGDIEFDLGGVFQITRMVLWNDCSAPGSLDTSLSHAAGLIEIAACHA